MPKRNDLNHILVIGSGPIVIGQACEFDYSGTQACRVLKQEGLRVTLINSNPATIMTDPEFADHTYIEPIQPGYIEKIFIAEREAGHPVDAVLATLGGQTALNAAIQLDRLGILEKHGVELIGADIPAIQRGEDRQMFKDIVASIGGLSARSAVCHNMDEVHEAVAELGLPVVVRPSFTMGGLAPAWRTPTRTSTASPVAASRRPRRPTSSSRSPSSAGRSSSSSSCATARTTPWWSAPSRTSTPSASTPVTL